MGVASLMGWRESASSLVVLSRMASVWSCWRMSLVTIVVALVSTSCILVVSWSSGIVRCSMWRSVIGIMSSTVILLPIRRRTGRSSLAILGIWRSILAWRLVIAAATLIRRVIVLIWRAIRLIHVIWSRLAIIIVVIVRHWSRSCTTLKQPTGVELG